MADPPSVVSRVAIVFPGFIPGKIPAGVSVIRYRIAGLGGVAGAFLALAALVGCNKNSEPVSPSLPPDHPTAALRGKVTFEGNPVSGNAFVQVVCPFGLAGIFEIGEDGGYQAAAPVGRIQLCVTTTRDPVAPPMGARGTSQGMPPRHPGGPGMPGGPLMPPGGPVPPPGGPIPPPGGPVPPPGGPGGLPVAPGGEHDPGQRIPMHSPLDAMPPEMRTVYELIERRYGNPQTTPLTFSIQKDGDQTLDLKLTAK